MLVSFEYKHLKIAAKLFSVKTFFLSFYFIFIEYFFNNKNMINFILYSLSLFLIIETYHRLSPFIFIYNEGILNPFYVIIDLVVRFSPFVSLSLLRSASLTPFIENKTKTKGVKKMRTADFYFVF